MFRYELPPFFVTDLFILESFDPESSKLCQTTVHMCKSNMDTMVLWMYSMFINYLTTHTHMDSRHDLTGN